MVVLTQDNSGATGIAATSKFVVGSGTTLSISADNQLGAIPGALPPVTGWVAAARVTVGTVRTRIVVDLSRKQVTLYRDGREVLRATAAIGARATPTPTGRFYVNQRLIPADPNGPYGPGAVGISAFSDVLTGWTQGGPIAIHGTNAPWSIGKAVSNGCIRLPNETLRRVFSEALAGTPVLIRR